MRYLRPDDSNVKPIDQSIDLTKALKDKSSTFAVTAARVAFGRNYPAEGHDGFVDRAPGELALTSADERRAAMLAEAGVP